MSAVVAVAHGNGVASFGGIADRVKFQFVSRVIYLNAPDHREPYGYNPLHHVRADKIALAVSGMLETLKKLWPDAWGVRMEHVLRNTLYALLERDDASLPDILRMYVDKGMRKVIVQDIKYTLQHAHTSVVNLRLIPLMQHLISFNYPFEFKALYK